MPLVETRSTTKRVPSLGHNPGFDNVPHAEPGTRTRFAARGRFRDPSSPIHASLVPARLGIPDCSYPNRTAAATANAGSRSAIVKGA
jgi:hypothetical protein